MVEALLTLYEASFDPRWFTEARALAETMIERFGDPERGGFFSTSTDHETLIARRKEVGDHPIPAGQSAAALGLLRLAALSGEARFADRAVGVFALFGEPAISHPDSFAHLLRALDFHLASTREVALVGGDLSGARSRRPRRPSAPTWSSPRGPAGAVEPPLLDARTEIGGEPAAYVCEGFTCQLPVTDPAALAARTRGPRLGRPGRRPRPGPRRASGRRAASRGPGGSRCRGRAPRPGTIAAEPVASSSPTPSSSEKQRERTVPSASSTQAQMQPTSSPSGRPGASSTASASSQLEELPVRPPLGPRGDEGEAALDPHRDLARGRAQDRHRLALLGEQPGGADARVPGEAELQPRREDPHPPARPRRRRRPSRRSRARRRPPGGAPPAPRRRRGRPRAGCRSSTPRHRRRAERAAAPSPTLPITDRSCRHRIGRKFSISYGVTWTR